MRNLVKISKLTFFLIALNVQAFSQNHIEKFDISGDLQVYKVSNTCYVHVSITNSPQFGKYPSNGLICISNGKAILFDSPSNDSLF